MSDIGLKEIVSECVVEFRARREKDRSEDHIKVISQVVNDDKRIPPLVKKVAERMVLEEVIRSSINKLDPSGRMISQVPKYSRGDLAAGAEAEDRRDEVVEAMNHKKVS